MTALTHRQQRNRDNHGEGSVEEEAADETTLLTAGSAALIAEDGYRYRNNDNFFYLFDQCMGSHQVTMQVVDMAILK